MVAAGSCVHLGLTDQVLNPILNGKRGISPDMAKAFGEAFDVPAEFFANLQQTYDLAQAHTPDPSVAVRRNMQTTYPIREMIKRGWLELSDAAMIEAQFARFFCAADSSGIPYFGSYAAKKGSYEERDIPPAQLAWLFRVRQIAQSLAAPRYSPKALRSAIAEFTLCCIRQMRFGESRTPNGLRRSLYSGRKTSDCRHRRRVFLVGQ